MRCLLARQKSGGSEVNLKAGVKVQLFFLPSSEEKKIAVPKTDTSTRKYCAGWNDAR